MGKPAARVGDNHICPMITPGLPPVPHVGGPILLPGTVNVLVCGAPAATIGAQCLCVAPVPDAIIFGSPTVLIGGRGAARLFDPTTHGGSIILGAPTVLIGEFAAVGAMSVFPGAQNFGNCGVQSAQQLVHQATGQNPDENTILDIALARGFAQNSANAQERGGTSAETRKNLLQAYGVPSMILSNPSKTDLAEALKSNKGVVANVDAGTLWNDSTYAGGGHAIVVTEGDFNEHGELTHVYINDTGTDKQGQRISADNMMKAMTDRKDANGNSSYQLNVTNTPIWIQIR